MDRVYLIDGSSFLYRFFFAIKGLSYNGFPTNAIFGFARLLLKLEEEKPKYVCVFFDTKAPTFRKDILESYKENRPKMPDELGVQVEPIKELIEAFGIPILEKDGFEADDLIASVAESLKGDYKVIIVASDKDLFQLVDDNVRMYDPIKDVLYDREKVYEKLGVYPEQVPDYLALVGDAIDNIPGVKSIGPKTASALLKKYGSIEGILEHVEELKPKVRRAILSEESLKSYRELTRLKVDTGVSISIEDLKKRDMDVERCREIFMKYGFSSLLSQLPEPETGDHEVVGCDTFMNRASSPVAIYPVDEKVCVASSGVESCSCDPLKIKEGFDCFVYDLKQLISMGFGDLGVPEDLKLAAYLLDSTSQGDVEKMFLNTDEAMLRKMSGLGSFGSKLLFAKNKIDELVHSVGLDFLLEVECKLSHLLVEMEKRGLKVDGVYLYGLKNELENRKFLIEERIYALAGEKFNINSTKELQRILFEKLHIKPVKKTKTGYSTDSESLERMKNSHEIAGLILEYRGITKLISTYIIPFLERIDSSGRIHTTFNQTLTATGRLSSSNPNLQNLPASDDEMHAGIRRAVISEEGYSLVCADYSQIELRVLCELSGDGELKRIFDDGLDVHTETAVKVFNVIPSMVDHNMRRMAKVINFGILYGMGHVSLSKTLGISPQKAKELIDNYFRRFSRVREFIDESIKFAEEHGYSETYFHRRRYFTRITGSDRRQAEFEKRAALNMRVQGTAADIIKIAMVRLREKLSGFDAHIVLQVHDELLIECENGVVDEVMTITKDVMENAVDFSTPLSVNIRAASNWFDAK